MKKGKIKLLVEFWCDKKMAEVEGRFNTEIHDNVMEIEKRADNLLERVQKLESVGHSDHVADAYKYQGLMDYQKFAYPTEKKADEAVKIDKSIDRSTYRIARKKRKPEHHSIDRMRYAEMMLEEKNDKRDFTNQEVHNMLSSNIQALEYLVEENHLSPRADRIIKSSLVHLKEQLSQINL